MKQKTQIKISTAAKKYEKIQKNKWYVIGLSSILLGLATIQLITFGTIVLAGGDSWIVDYVSSHTFPNANQVTLTWLALSLSMASAIPGILSGILMGQRWKYAFIFFYIAYAPLMVNSVILGLWYDLIKLISICLLMTIGFINWNKNSNKEEPKVTSLGMPKFIISFLIVIGFALSVGAFTDMVLMKNNLLPRPTQTWMVYIDASILILTIYSFILITMHKKEAYWIFYLCNIMAVTLFSGNGIYVTAMQHIIYMTVDAGGLLTWTSRYNENKIEA